jgi:phosphoglycerate kinase
MNLPRVDGQNFSGKKVILRADVDVGDKVEEGDEIKIRTVIPTLEFLLARSERVILIGHRGRPDGKVDDSLSLRPLVPVLQKLLRRKVEGFIEYRKIEDFDSLRRQVDESSGDLLILENLRFWPQEEANHKDFGEKLSTLGDFYVNEAFSASHRKHASIVGIPGHIPHAAGLHFLGEVENLSRVIVNPKRPVIVLISGVKKDKLDYIEDFKKFADKILVSGALPEFLPEEPGDDKLLVAQLLPDKMDITLRSIENFEAEIAKAATIVVNGPMGKFEDKGYRQGTERILGAIAGTSAFKVAGGGDTEQAIAMFNLENKFSWISVGGGAMLEFLAKGTLPGIEALID